MSEWINFATKNTKTGGNVNSSVPGGKFVGLGTQLLTIQSVEQAVTRNGDGYLKIFYANQSGQTMMDRLYPLYGENGDSKQSFKYKSLAHAIVPEDGTLRFEFFTNSEGLLPSDASLWAGLVGLTVEAEVVAGDSGYTIEDDGGVYRLFDVKSQEFIQLSGGVPNEFGSYKEARETATGQGLYRAWNKINKFGASVDHVGSNFEAITALKNEYLSSGSI
jgi:hypothetical protein